MKRLISILILMILIGTGCRSVYQLAPLPEVTLNEPSDTNYSPDAVGIQTIVESGDNYAITMHFPVLGYRVIDNELKNFIDNRYALYTQEVAEIQRNTETSELHLAYEIVNKTDTFVSILFKETKYLGGVQDITMNFTFTYDLNTEKLLTLQDFFGGSESYLKVLSDLSYNILITDGIIPNAIDLNWVKGGLYPVEKNFTNYLFDSDNIVLLFNKYQLGPAFLGEPEISISYATLSEYLPLTESLIKALKTPSVKVQPQTDGPVEIMPDYEPANAYRPKHGKSIAITFDLGPHPTYTPVILDTLKRYNANATFFLLGNRVSDYPDIAKRIVDENHLIGNMTYSHRMAIRLTADQYQNEINRAQEEISKHTGFKPNVIRLPFGALDDNIIQDSEYPIVLWSIDPEDLLYNDPDYIVSYILDHAFDGAIIRLHDNNSSTTQAIGPLIENLTNAGYNIVTVSELLDLNKDGPENDLKTYYRAIQ